MWKGAEELKLTIGQVKSLEKIADFSGEIDQRNTGDCNGRSDMVKNNQQTPAAA